MSILVSLGFSDNTFVRPCEKYVSIIVGVTAVPTDMVLNTMVAVAQIWSYMPAWIDTGCSQCDRALQEGIKPIEKETAEDNVIQGMYSQCCKP